MGRRHKVRFVGHVSNVDKPTVIKWFRHLFAVLNEAPPWLDITVEVSEYHEPGSNSKPKGELDP